MPAIGDQVASLEHDYTAALAKIDSLLAENAAIKAAHAAVTADNAALNKYADEIKAMVESVANGALKMLEAAQFPIVAAVEKEVVKVVAEVKTEATRLFDPPPSITGALPLAPVIDEINAAALVAIDPRWRNADGSQIAAAGDSGDEQPEPVPQPEPPAAPISEPPAQTGAAESPFASIGAAISKEAARVEAEIAAVPDAVNRMLHHSSGSPTTIRRPVDMTMHVDHDEEGLPMFLRRGTAFDTMAREQLFG